ncbi:prolipoprotein diacylglyceryl transferase [Compostibacter hankyongensis]|uniref:Phosphatidylglycerol--prolipoprotein diacylglyceryl transferase n=1 Tax=Compostibacter hankyongensis TaxID=1007089 RepID=A0ABP8FQA6_9BACT
MYPTVSDLLHDLLGIRVPLPIQTFGFFVVVAFLGAAYTLMRELKRREELGWMKGVTESYWVGRPAGTGELLWNGILGFIIGFKLVYALSHWSAFSANPQQVLLSVEGNWPGALAFAALFVFLRYRDKKKRRLDPPRQEKRTVMPHQRVGDFTVLAAIGGLVGAKIFDGLENWNSYMADPVGSFFSFSGLTFYGGLIVAAIAIIWYARSKQISGWHLVDSAAPALMLAYGLGRIGCHMAGDGDWGIENPHPKPFAGLPDWLWSYTYPHNVNNAGVPIPGCEGPHCFQLPHGVYPTPLYEVIACLILFGVLWSIRKKITRPGMMFGIYFIFTGIERFLVETIRVNTRYHFLGISPTQAEIISTLLVISGIGLILYVRKKHAALPLIPAKTAG